MVLAVAHALGEDAGHAHELAVLSLVAHCGGNCLAHHAAVQVPGLYMTQVLALVREKYEKRWVAVVQVSPAREMRTASVHFSKQGRCWTAP